MKIILIEPRAAIANVYSKLHMPLLGPVYLGTILRQRGHQVTVYNEEIFTPDYKTLDADLVGISILTSTAKRGYEIARMFPKEKVIMGGVHASLLPEEAIQYCRQVVVGEAEDVIIDVAEGRQPQACVQGRPVQHLDALPFPDLSLIQGLASVPHITPISTSRGCPFDCSFCSVTKMFGRQYRFRTAENVMEELVIRGKGKIFFTDDNFTAHPIRARKLLNMMRKIKIGDWACQVRCDAARHEHMLRLMAKAGCKMVCVGFESVNQKTLQAYNKKQTVEDVVKAINAFHKKGIMIHGMFVVGSDKDDETAALETARFAKDHDIETIQMMILTPLPGTRTYEELNAQGRIFSKDWDLYDGQHVVFYPQMTSAQELQSTVVNAYMFFYTIPRAIKKFLQFRFLNAMFVLMGHAVVKHWRKHNCHMSWLPPAQMAGQGENNA